MNIMIYDAIGIGFGPANIAVAIAMEELDYKGKVLFLEKDHTVTWQKNMLLENSDIQNHPLRDLVTPANPRSKYTFVNFLYENGRLFEHLNLGMYFPFRIEYNQYIQWVASHFEHLVKYNTSMSSIELIDHDEDLLYKITSNQEVYYSRSIIVGTGRTPHIPAEFSQLKTDKVIHLTKYLSRIKMYEEIAPKKVLVIGGSQSAVELISDLSNRFPEAQIHGMTKSFGYRMKDVGPFTGEVYFPEFVDIFYNADSIDKKRMINDLHFTNYSATDLDALDSLYRKIYQQKILKNQKIFIHRSADVTDVKEQNNGITVEYNSIEHGKSSLENFDLVILATGFKNIGTSKSQETIPHVFRGLTEYLTLNEEGCIDVYPNYEVKMKPEAINSKCFMNGFCESSHGMGDAGSFSLLSLRSRAIVDALQKLFLVNNKKYILDFEI